MDKAIEKYNKKQSKNPVDNKIIVYTSGTFDMFHSNHLKMIKYARGLGDILIIGVSTDELVESYKPAPIIPFHERINIIEALKYPDIVIPQHTLDHRQLAQNLNINIFVVGDDWTGKFDYLHEYNVKVFYFPYGKGISTTRLKEQIVNKYKEMIKLVDEHDNKDIITK